MNSNSLGQRERKVGEKGGRGWASGNVFIVNPRHDNCTQIASHSRKSAYKPLGTGISLRSRSRQEFGQCAGNTSNLRPDRLPCCVAEVAKTLDSVPAIYPICGQIGYRVLANFTHAVKHRIITTSNIFSG